MSTSTEDSVFLFCVILFLLPLILIINNSILIVRIRTLKADAVERGYATWNTDGRVITFNWNDNVK